MYQLSPAVLFKNNLARAVAQLPLPIMAIRGEVIAIIKNKI
jgi:hypothetical protein